MLKHSLALGLIIGVLSMSTCGGASNPPVPQPTASATPRVTPIGTETPIVPTAAAELSANSFRFEVTGAGEDKVIAGGLVQYAPASTSHSWALTEVGNSARYGAILFTPLAIEMGEHPLIPYTSAYAEGYSAALLVDAESYNGNAGTLIIEDVSNNTISGRFEFTAQHEDDVSQVVQVKGEFKQISVPPADNNAPASLAADDLIEPTATSEATAVSTAQPAAGEFWFCAANNDLDVFVGSGIIQSDVTPNGHEYQLVLQGDGDPAQHVVTLFLPFDLKPGEITLKPYVANADPIGPSASFSTGFDLYEATEGTLTLDKVSGDTLTGSFVFKAISSGAAEKNIAVAGEFSGIALAKKRPCRMGHPSRSFT